MRTFALFRLLFAIASCLAISNCASATIFYSSSGSAVKYINCKPKKIAKPYYSETRIALCSTPITLKKDDYNNQEFLFQFGLGGGICLKGSIWDFNFSSVTSKKWGGSINFNSNITKSKNIPSDWAEGGRTFYPKDYLSTISVNLTRSFSTSKEFLKFRIEAGPSWVRHSNAELELNPSYDPNPDPDLNCFYKIGTVYKYDKSRSGTNTVGLSLMGKMELLKSRHTGFKISVFTNINNLKSIAGLDVCFIFGKLKPRF